MAVNNGKMPVLIDATDQEKFRNSNMSDHIVLNNTTRFPILADIIMGVSVGDMVIFLGSALLAFY